MDTDPPRIAILRALVAQHPTAAAFARAYDVDVTYIRQLLSGHRTLGEKAAKKLGEKIANNPVLFESAQTLPAPSPAAPGPDFIPVERVLLKVSAGVTGYQVEHLQGNGPPIFFRADWIASKGYRADRLIALRVTGDSMEPNLWDGDLVVLNSADTQPRDGEVFVANYEGEVVIKRLERNAGEWWLTSDNARHKPKRCDEHAELIGRVVYKQSERI
jgi:phage repressor protein C with HTH and peptisase S24 domain